MVAFDVCMPLIVLLMVDSDISSFIGQVICSRVSIFKDQPWYQSVISIHLFRKIKLLFLIKPLKKVYFCTKINS